MPTLKITSGHDVAVDINEMPEYKERVFARHTLHAVERFFALPGVREDYEKWLKEDYEKRKAV